MHNCGFRVQVQVQVRERTKPRKFRHFRIPLYLDPGEQLRDLARNLRFEEQITAYSLQETKRLQVKHPCAIM